MPAHNLLTTWAREQFDRESVELISAGLTRAEITVDPALEPGMAEDAPVLLAVVAPQRTAPEQDTPARPPRTPAPAGRTTPDRDEAPRSPGPTEALSEAVRRFADNLQTRRRLRRVRAHHDRLLQSFGSMVFELYRADARRPELVRRRLEELHDSSVEMAELEARLGRSPEGGVCPSCGLYCGDAQCCLACGEDLAQASRPVSTRMSTPMAVFALVVLTGAWFFGGIRPEGESEPEPAAKRTERAAAKNPGPTFRNTVADVRRKGPMPIYRRPGGRPFRRLSNPNADGAPLAFLVKRQRGGWAQVYLPARPNGSTGWIRLSQVSVSGHNYRVVIDLSNRRLSAYRGRRRLMRVAVGVGEAVTPTPTGLYFITELLKQPDNSGTYGPWAFGLSAYSNVLNEFAGADGILGIHGTNEPWAVGTNVSHGCIRVNNRTISRLARTLPVGTPVRIRRS